MILTSVRAWAVIGYDFPDADTLRLYNNDDEYFFNKTSGVQFTNNYQEYWTRNVFCAGFNSGAGWDYYCNDAFPFSWSIVNDSTEVNITGTLTVIKGGSTYRAILRYHLKENDTNLTVIPAVRSINGNFTGKLGFLWSIKDIQISNDTANDFIEIYPDTAFLNQTFERIYINNMTVPKIYYGDVNTSESLWLQWNQDYDYIVNVTNNVGHTLLRTENITPGQTKGARFEWKDATCSWSCFLNWPLSQTDIYKDDIFQQTAHVTYSGSCGSSATLAAQHEDGTWQNHGGGTNLSLQGFQFNPSFVFVSGSPFNRTWTVTGSETGVYNIRSYCVFNSQTKTSSTQVVNVSEFPISEGNCSYTNLTSSETLTGNVDGCYNLTASGITLDCAGYKIKGHTWTRDYAITAENVNNIKILNCDLNNTPLGIYFKGVNDSNITNFNMHDTNVSFVDYPYSYAVHLVNSHDNNMYNVNYTNMFGYVSNTSNCYKGASHLALVEINSYSNNWTNLYFDNASVRYYDDGGEDPGCQPGIFQHGQTIHIKNSYNNTFYIVNSTGGVQDNSGLGCGFFYCSQNCTGLNLTNLSYTDGDSFTCGTSVVDSNNLHIKNYWGMGNDVGIGIINTSYSYFDNITILGGNGNDGGQIQFGGVYYSLIQNLYIDHVDGWFKTSGISYYDTVEHSNFSNITIYNQKENTGAVELQAKEFNSIYENIVINNVSGTGTDSGFYVGDDKTGVVIRNVIINASNYVSGGAFYLIYRHNVTVYNMTITNVLGGYDVFNQQANFTLVDCVFNKSNVGFGLNNVNYGVYVNYSVRVNITNTTDNIQGVFNITNNDDVLIYQDQDTGSDGVSDYLIVGEYRQYGMANYTEGCVNQTWLHCYTPFNVSGYNNTASNSSLYNVSNSFSTVTLLIAALISEDTCTPPITGDWVMNETCNINETYYDLTGKNFICDSACNFVLRYGTMIVGNLTRVGNTTWEYSNITILN